MPVYFAQAGKDGPVKIGWATDPARRVNDLQIGHPEKLTIIRVVDGDLKTETALHRHFWRERIRREWFRFHGDMLTVTPALAVAPPRPLRAALAMRPFSTIQLLALAEAYCAATNETLHALSGRVSDTNNHKLFGRLKEGRGCSAEYLERASLWFVENWPADVPWPETVPREWAA